MEEVAIFHAAYPGLDPMGLTMAKFFGLAQRGAKARRTVDGREVDALVGMAERQDRELALDAWLEGVGGRD